MNTIKLELDLNETNLILEALGQLPFTRVFKVIARIQEQAQLQLQQLQLQQPAPATEAEES